MIVGVTHVEEILFSTEIGGAVFLQSEIDDEVWMFSGGTGASRAYPNAAGCTDKLKVSIDFPKNTG